MADDYDMNALLKSYNAPMTARNANAARQFFASNPEVAAHRAMGMRGSVLDDNSDLLNSMLDHVINQTDNVPQGQVQVGQPQKIENQAPVEGTRGAKSSAGQVKPKMDLNNDMTALKPSPSNKGNYGPGTPTPRENASQYGPNVPDIISSGGGGDSGWMGDILKLILGIGSAGGAAGARGGLPAPVNGPEATFAGRMPREGAGGTNGQLPRNVNAIDSTGGDTQLVGNQPKLENQGPTTVRNSPDLEAAGRQQSDKKMEIYKDIADENAANDALMQQIAKRNRDQGNAEALVKSAKRAVGRR